MLCCSVYTLGSSGAIIGVRKIEYVKSIQSRGPSDPDTCLEAMVCGRSRRPSARGALSLLPQTPPICICASSCMAVSAAPDSHEYVSVPPPLPGSTLCAPPCTQRFSRSRIRGLWRNRRRISAREEAKTREWCPKGTLEPLFSLPTMTRVHRIFRSRPLRRNARWLI